MLLALTRPITSITTRPRRLACLVMLALASVITMVTLTGCVKTQVHPPLAAPKAALLSCTPHTVSRLYFGLNSPDGPISDALWQTFVQSEITPRLPGFTLLAASGQWRGDDGVLHKEESRVLEVVAKDDAAHRTALVEIVSRYKARFRQESVLITQSPTRACW
jgi:Protein of unknown function (DUF3574)